MQDKDKYIQVTGFVEFVKNISSFVWKKRIKIVIAGALFAALGLVASFVVKPKYVGELTFVLQNEDDMGGMSGLASQFGLSVGSSTGTFSGDNIYELLMSRLLVEKALLSPLSTENGKTNLLNVYIDTYKLRKKWKKHKEENVRNLDFPPGQYRETFSREQDSVMGVIYDKFILKSLQTHKVDKKLSVGIVQIESKSELFSKYFVEKLMEETSKFYVDTKTKVSRTNYHMLELQADSIREEYSKAVVESASLADQTLNALRQSATTEQMKKQTDVQILATTYIEMRKNMELMKMTINKQTPLIEIIDRPILPLEEKKIGKLIGLLVGGFLGVFLIVGFYVMLFVWENRERLL